MEMTKHWERWTQKHKIFPTDKYGFSKYLKEKGDFLETHPLSLEDASRIKKAAENWAYHHKVRVSVYRHPAGEGLQEVRITLTDLHRNREYW